VEPGSFTSGIQQMRLAAYLDGLGHAAGHADRVSPLMSYCTGLLLPGERKSVEPMAARLAPDNVRRMHQSLHHLVADAPWSDETLLAEVRSRVLASMRQQGPVVAWIVDDIGFPKKGAYSVGVTRQCCGLLGKQENCRVAVSLSAATWAASLPIAFQLYLPEPWASDENRRHKAGVPEQIGFRTKPQIAMAQIQEAVTAGVPRGVVLAGAGYGDDAEFRGALTELDSCYVVGVQSSTSVWAPGSGPLSVKQLAETLPESAWKNATWYQGTEHPLRSRFAAVRVRVTHRDHGQAETNPEEWLLVEWPKSEGEPTMYWLSTVSRDTHLRCLVKMAKHRWIIERDYEELKQELGLGHFEGRGWRGFHHHATLCIAAYGFLVAERISFSPSARAGRLALSAPEVSPTFRPRGCPALVRMA
jgi:SRSO17 transposase